MVRVKDENNDPVVGAIVIFRVVENNGVTLNSDSDGRVLTRATLGPDAGNDNNIVAATFDGNQDLPATFVASGRVAGAPAATTISGVVLDNEDIPIQGVYAYVAFTGLSTQTDEQGQFVLANAPVGMVRLVIDGSTAQRSGTWPHLVYDLVTIPGQNNTVGMPIHLLPLDMAHGVYVDATHGGTLTLPDMPGFALEIAPGSATFLNPGACMDGPPSIHCGLVTATVVHADKMPMAPGFGQQPRFVVIIQPTNTLFDPPAALAIPNVEGLTPGEITDMYSFDHDIGQFVSIGPGTVSDDGSVLRSNPGVGVLKGGWQCGGNPAVAGSAQDAQVSILRTAVSRMVAVGGPVPIGNPAYTWASSQPNIATAAYAPGNTSQTNPNAATLSAVSPGLAAIRATYRCESGEAATDTKNVAAFLITCYQKTFESDFRSPDNPAECSASPGTPLHDPHGLVGDFCEAFLRTVRGSGSGEALDGSLIQIDYHQGDYRASFATTFFGPVNAIRTASGRPLTAGVSISVDPSIIPLGPSVEIDGYGTRRADDTGQGIAGFHIDLFGGFVHNACNGWPNPVKLVQCTPAFPNCP